MENSNVGEQTQHALFQLTGALRHIAAGEGALPLFVTTNCIPIMCKVWSVFFFNSFQKFCHRSLIFFFKFKIESFNF